MDIRKLLSLMACMALGLGVAVGCESNTEVVVDDEPDADIRYSAPDDDSDYRSDVDVNVNPDRDYDRDYDRNIDRDVDIDYDVDVD